MSLMPPNTTAAEQALSEAGRNDLSSDPIRAIWNPDTCPMPYLPWLAWAFSVDVWRAEWPEHIKRGVIKAAIKNHKIKGTRKSVEAAVLGFGADLDISEWFNSFTAAPHSFAVTINYGGSQIDTQLQQDIATAIDRVKPVRSYYSVNTGIQAEQTLNIGGALRITQQIHMELQAA